MTLTLPDDPALAEFAESDIRLDLARPDAASLAWRG